MKGPERNRNYVLQVVPQIASIPCQTLIVIQTYGLLTKVIRSRSLVICLFLRAFMDVESVSIYKHVQNEFGQYIQPSSPNQLGQQACNSCIPIPHEDRVVPNSDLPRLSVGQSREFYQTTTATATRTSRNKRFNEQNNSCARAFWIFVHFYAVLRKTTTWND